MINKQSIQLHLSKGELRKAIDELMILGERYDSDLYNSAIHQSGRLAALQQSISDDVLTSQEANRTKNKIRLAVTSIVDENVKKEWKLNSKSNGDEDAPAAEKNDDAEQNHKVLLFVAANPKEADPLRLGEEVNRIETALERSALREKYILEQKWATKIKDLRQAMLKYNPNIVHFSGHGSTSGKITLEDAEGYGQEVAIEALGNFFALFADRGVNLVLLNACYSEAQAKEIIKHIEYVIGMSDKIPDVASIAFSEAFYDAIGSGESIDFAFKIGVNAIQMHDLEADHIPILLKKA